MNQAINNDTNAQHDESDPPTAIQPGGGMETVLNSTRDAARRSESAQQLHRKLCTDLESLRRNRETPTFGPPTEDPVLRLCIAALDGGQVPGHLRGEAMGAYHEQPDDYDLVLGDVLPAEFRRRGRQIHAQRAYFANTNATAAGDWGAFIAMRPESGGNHVPGLPTGVPRLDDMLGGLQGLVFLGGNKGTGKTSLALQMVLAATHRDPHLGALIYSLDMVKTRIYERILCLEAGVGYRMLHRSDKPADVQDRIAETDQQLQEAILPRLRVIERRFEYERDHYNQDAEAQRQGLRACNVLRDCGQLMRAPGVKRIVLLFDLFQKMDPYGQVADGAAKDHYRLDLLSEVMLESAGPRQPRGFPILVTSEIRKDARKDALTMDDLKGDGRMASDADTVLLMWPDKGVTNTADTVIPTTLRIDKCREGGQRGDLQLWFEHQCFLFHDEEPTTDAQNLDPIHKIASSGEDERPPVDSLG